MAYFLHRHTRSEEVLVTATQALETIALRCCEGGGGAKNGRACVQDALLLSNQNHAFHDDANGENEDILSATLTGGVNYSRGDGGASNADACDVSAVSAATSSSFPEVDGVGVGTATTDGQEREALVGLTKDGDSAESMEISRRGHAEWEREDAEVGATSFALRVADSYSRDDSRTIVRRAGAARVAASALGLLRALLTDCGQRRQAEDGAENGVQRDTGTEYDEDDEASLACCVEEFCDEQVFWYFLCFCARKTGAMLLCTVGGHAVVGF